VNLITPYKETELHGPNFTCPPPDLIEGEQEFKVEKILDAQQKGKGHKMHFLVKWKGYPISDNFWEPRENLHTDELIEEYNKKKQEQMKPKKKGHKSKGVETEGIIHLFSPALQHLSLQIHIMSAHSAPVSSLTPASSQSLLVLLAPDNMPTKRDPIPILPNNMVKLLKEVATTTLQDYESDILELEYPPQLGQRTVPIVEVEVTVASTIDYK